MSVDCQVIKIQPRMTLSYSWAAHGPESVVTWTLTPTSKGTNLRLEQLGFRPDREQSTWLGKLFAKLEQVLARDE
jgi:uncharacterized protein YndB with AHSA1/START domain